MIVAAINVITNWIGFWSLSAVTHWNVEQVMLQLTIACSQYFTCSLVSMKVPEDGVVDMQAFYDRARVPILTSFAVLAATAMVWNYAERGIPGLAPGVWIVENAFCAGFLALLAVAGWARPRWAQVSVAAVVALVSAIDLAFFAMAP